VKRVVVGILDPNPQIYATSYKRLRAAGIEVQLFEHDLVLRIEDMNLQWIREQGAKLTSPVTAGEVDLEGVEIRRGEGGVGIGGAGGGGRIIGNRGTIIGGRGGHAGTKGIAGKGGSGFIQGDDGLIVGGDGGNCGTPDRRGGRGARGPTERIGGPTDTWRYGRGGSGANHPEYNRRIALLKSIRMEYMAQFPDKVPFIDAGVDPVPINWVNKRLEELHEDWRVEMGSGGYILPALPASDHGSA
jgi:hypothetical protein